MKDIFKGDLISAQKALNCLAYKNRFSDEFIQPFINKYKDKKFYTYRCYINDKGNLILERNWFKYYLKDNYFTELVERQKDMMGWKTDENRSDIVTAHTINGIKRFNKKRLAELRYESLLKRINCKRYELNEENIENIYIKNEKIIVKSYKEVYYICNRKIRRVDLSKLDSDFKIWIAKMLINPFEISNNKINNFNYITNEIYTEICRKDAIMDYQNNPLYSDWYQPDITAYNSYGKYMPFTKNQILEYKNTIANYFPLIQYTNYLFRNNFLNSFTQEFELPTYLKKTIATNFKTPKLSKDNLEFLVQDETPVINKSDNHDILDAYSLCKALKLKDVNIIKKFINSRIGLNDVNYKEVKLYYKYLQKYYTGKVKNIELLLFNRLADNDLNGNVAVAQGRYNRVIDNNVRDSLQMFYKAITFRRYIKDKPFKKLDIDYLITHSLKDIHDTLSQISRDDTTVLHYQNFDEVNDYETFEKEVGNQKFLMPRNSCELVRLADIMRNCVASYQSNIMRKFSIIVYGTNNDEIINYIRNGEGDLKDLTNKLEANQIPSPACIEIAERPSGYWYDRGTTDETTELKVIQCYGRHNRTLSTLNNDLANACSTYFEDVKARLISTI